MSIAQTRTNNNITNSNKNINENRNKLNTMISLINTLQERGKHVEMKNKVSFELTLTETKSIITKNIDFFSINEEASYIDIMKRLTHTINDLEDKLNNLALVNFCRSKAEKYLESTRKDLSYINLVLMTVVSEKNAVTTTPMEKANNKNYDKDIIDLNEEIALLRLELANNKSVVVERIIEKPSDDGKSKEKVVKKAKPDEVIISKKQYDYFCALEKYYGVNGTKDYSKAFKLLNNNSNNDDGSTHNNHINTIDNSNPASNHLLAMMYLKGEYTKKNITKALGLFKSSSVQGYSPSSLQLAYLAEKGFLIDSDKTQIPDLDNKQRQSSKNDNDADKLTNFETIAFKYYLLAAKEQNSSKAYAILSRIYQNGSHNQIPNIKKSFEYLNQAIKIDNNPEALNLLGNYYYYGNEEISLKKNLKRAFELYLESSKSGNVDAINSLGVCYEFGFGVEVNKDKAFECYSIAAEEHNSSGLANKAVFLIENFSKNTSYSGYSRNEINYLNYIVDNGSNVYLEAFKLLLLAVSINPDGNKNAYYYLGYIYENGLHCSSKRKYNDIIPYSSPIDSRTSLVPDIISAYRMYKKAMKRGHIKAQTKVAIVLTNGIPNYLEKDEYLSFKLLESAADNGDIEAANYLGLLYEKGNNVIMKDLEKSFYYYNIAHEGGNNEATYNLAYLTKIEEEKNKDNYNLISSLSGRLKSNMSQNNNNININNSIRTEYVNNLNSSQIMYNNNSIKFPNKSINMMNKTISGFNNNNTVYFGNYNSDFDELLKLSAKRGNVMALKMKESNDNENISLLKSFIKRTETNKIY